MADQHYTRQTQQRYGQGEQQHYGQGEQQHYGQEDQHYQQPFMQKLHFSTPSSRQAVKFLTASTLGTVFLVLSALILTGTVISLIIATPVLVLFSPILVPAVITVVLIASGFIFSGGCGVAALSALSWIYQYVTGKHPVGADQLDEARRRIADAAYEVKEKAKEGLHYDTHRGQEGTTTTTGRGGQRT